MPEDEKDRLGDTLKKKERGDEEKYFAEQERLRLAKLRAQLQATAHRQTAGPCPRCGRPLVVRRVRGITVDECEGGCGIWLDKGEVEQLGSSIDERASLVTTLLIDLGLLGKP